MSIVNVTLDGKQYEIESGTDVRGFLKKHFPADEFKYMLAMKDNKLCELGKVIDSDCKLEMLTRGNVMGLNAYKRSLTLLLVKSFAEVLNNDNDYIVSVMYSMGKGYFCKLTHKIDGGNRTEQVTVDDKLLDKVLAKMQQYVDEDTPIYKESLRTDDAIARFAADGREDKAKLFRFRRASKVNIYTLDGYSDYFYGYMVPSAGYIKYFDVFAYDDGFVLMAPGKEAPDKIRTFMPQKKLYQVLKTSDEWAKTLDVDCVGDLNYAITTGDITELMLVQEALQEKQIAQIADQIKEGGKKIVLIAGPSSSGKTTFSHRLSVQLRAHGLRPYPLALDNYFLEREQTPKDEFGNYDFECIEAMDLKLFNSDMKKLLAGEEVQIPTFNFTLGKKEYKGKTLKFNEGDVLVAEGIHGLNPKMTSELPDDSKFKIYISALTQLNIDEHNRIPTTDGRLIRRIVRDARTRGSDARNTISMWPSVRRGEEKYIFPFQEESDAMFNSALIYELSVIKQFAEPLLFAVPRDSDEYFEAKRLLKFLDYFLGIDVTNIPKNSILREFVGGGCFDL